MSLSRTVHAIAGLAFVSAVPASPATAQERSPLPVAEYTVFVDVPTAFAFIKLPTGWKFVGKLDASQLKHLPPGTVTALLPPEVEPLEVAVHHARSSAER
jgi:hypothetical protein